MKSAGDLLAGLANSGLQAKPNPPPVFDNKAPLECSHAHSADGRSGGFWPLPKV